jgi:rare lipoprotein A
MKRLSILLLLSFSIAALGSAQAPSGTLTFKQEGIASWYGTEFDGRQTASGEIFDSTQYTAAHPSLPFGTILTVTNTQNNKQVRVRVNDRGPFVHARIVDLSKAAAEALDMVLTGTAPVIIESASNDPTGTVQAVPVTAAPAAIPELPAAPVVVSELVPAVTAAPVIDTPTVPLTPVTLPAPISMIPQSPRAAAILGGIPQAGNGKIYRLQVGAYRVPRNAVEAFDKLKAAGLDPAYERIEDLYRVVLAGLSSEEIPLIAEKLGSVGFAEAIIREEH